MSLYSLISRWIVTLLAFGAPILLPARAAAQWDDEPPRRSSRERAQRVFGLGTAIGGGVAVDGAVNWTGGAAGPGVRGLFVLPTVELQFFTPLGHSIDVTIPLTDIVVVSAVTRSFFFNADAFYNFNLGKGSPHVVLGPGLGFTAAGIDGTAFGALRLTGEAGVEVLNGDGDYGLRVMARPWAEVEMGSVHGVAGGALAVLAFTGYWLK